MEHQTTRLILTDRNGKYGTVFARAGERVYAYHPRHLNYEPATLFPESGGIIFLYGGLLMDVLDTIHLALDRPLDYVILRDKEPERYEPLLHMNEVVGAETTVARVGRAVV